MITRADVVAKINEMIAEKKKKKPQLSIIDVNEVLLQMTRIVVAGYRKSMTDHDMAPDEVDDLVAGYEEHLDQWRQTTVAQLWRWLHEPCAPSPKLQ